MTHMSRQIGSAIESVLKQLGIGERLRQYEVLDIWPKVVGERISNVTKAERIHDGKLFVSVKYSTWRNELIFLKKELITKINESMDQNVVKDIIFH